MTEAVVFPSYWGPKDGDPILARSALEIEEGWVQHYGRYNVQTGQWEPRDPLDHDGKDGKGGATKQQGDDINALRAAYFDKFKKRPFNGWDAPALRAKLEA